jgi:cytoskeletal protein CcmA (bactofilin family)
MRTRRFPKLIFMLGLASLLSLALVGTALAFENREGDIVIIDSGEVVADDLYVFARDFTLNGTVQGDLVTFGSQITIGPSGVVEGDLIGAGQSLVINGQVQDDVRIAGGVLVLGPGAQVTDDFISAGFSLETGAGSTIGGDAAFAGNQALLAGDIDGNLHAAAEGVSIQGSVGGNVDATVGSPTAAPPFSPFSFMPNMPPVPTVPGGLTVGRDAQIGGDLNYESGAEALIPPGAVGGEVNRTVPEVKPAEERERAQPSTAARTASWFLKNLRNFLGLLVFGLLLIWLAPKIVQNSAAALQTKPLPGLGWGLVSLVAAFFAVLVLIAIVIVAAILLGILTLGDLVGTIVSGGLLAVGVFVFAFGVAVTYLSQIIVSYLGGKLILSRLKPDWAIRPYLPFILGLIILVILAAIPYLGGLITFLVVVLGLGALWLLGMQWMRDRRPAPAPIAPAD